MIRTAQPLLIREQFAEETARMGFTLNRQTGSICAVPLILYDRADRRDGRAQRAGTALR